jgi:hypothetical protein
MESLQCQSFCKASSSLAIDAIINKTGLFGFRDLQGFGFGICVAAHDLCT